MLTSIGNSLGWGWTLSFLVQDLTPRRGVSPEQEKRKATVGKICGKGRF